MRNPKFVPESEAVTDKPFWESGVNPVTMTKFQGLADVIETEDTFVDYDYTF